MAAAAAATASEASEIPQRGETVAWEVALLLAATATAWQGSERALTRATLPRRLARRASAAARQRAGLASLEAAVAAVAVDSSGEWGLR